MNIICLIFCCSILAIFNATGRETIPETLVIILIILYSIIFITNLKNKYENKNIKQIIIISYIFRLFLLFVDIYARDYFILPNSGDDTEMFYWNAVRVLNGGESSRGIFVYVIYSIFSVCGISRLWIQFLIMLCSMITLDFIYKTLKICKINNIIIKYSMLILAFSPNLSILSCILSREAIICMFVSVSLFYFIAWIIDNEEQNFIFSIIFSMIPIVFHSGVISILISYILIRLIYDSKNGEFIINRKNIIFSILMACVVYLIIVHFQKIFLVKFYNIDSMEDIANTNSFGNSSYAEYVGNSNSIINFILFTPLRIIFFLFSPLPILWRSVSDVIAFFLDAMIFIVSLFCSVKYLVFDCERNSKRNIIISLLILAFLSSFIFGWGVTNAGTACRHRNKFISIYIVLLAIGNKENKRII